MKTAARSVEAERVEISSAGDTLVGSFFVPESTAPVPVLLLCHGAGEFKEHYFELAEFLAAHGVAALALDMHGHGESGGERFHVRMEEWVQDVRSAVDFLHTDSRIESTRIGAFGLSSGATAILEAAAAGVQLKALAVLDATVRNSLGCVDTSILRLLIWVGWLKKRITGRELRLPVLKLFGKVKIVSDPASEAILLADPRTTEAFLDFPFPGAADSFFVDTIKRVDAVKAATLIIWGAEDQLDPVATGELLYRTLTCEKRLEIVPGNGHAGHLDRNRTTVFELTLEWVRAHLA